MKKSGWPRRATIFAGVSVVLVVVYAAAGFLLAPRLLESYLEREITQRTALPADVDAVHVNPFALTASLGKVRIGAAEHPTLSVDEAAVNVELGGLFARRWTITSVRVVRPVLNATVLPNGEVDIVQTIARMRGRSPPDETNVLPPFLVRRLSIEDATISLTDPSAPRSAGYRLHPLNLEVEQLGSTRGNDAPYRLSTGLPDAGTMQIEGRLSVADRKATGKLTAGQVRLSDVWPLLHRVVSGPALTATIGVGGTFAFEYEDAPSLRLDELSISMSDIGAGHGEAHLLSLESAAADGGRFDLRGRSIAFSSVELHTGSLHMTPIVDGRVGWHTPQPEQSAPSRGTMEVPADKPWQVSLEAVRVSDVSARLCQPDAGERFCASITVERASAALSAHYGSARAAVRVKALDASLTDLQVAEGAGGSDQAISIGKLSIDAGFIDTGERRIGATRVAVNGGRVELERTARGDLALLGAFMAAAPASKSDAPSKASWQYAVGEVRAQDLAFQLSDFTFKPPLELAGTVRSASLADIDSEARGEMPFDASVGLAAGGSATIRGTVERSSRSGSAHARIEAAALELVNPIVSRYANVDVSGGTLSADARLQVSRIGGQAHVRGAGSLSVAGLQVRERDSGEQLLSWNSLAATDLAFSSSEKRLTVEHVDIDAPRAKLVITEDRTFEAAQLLTEKAASSDSRETRDAVERSVGDTDGNAQSEDPDWRFGIQRVSFRDGEIEFSDRSLVLPFAIGVSAFEGALVGLDRGMAIDGAPPARVEAHGRVGEYGEVAVTGDVDLIRPTSALDLHASFSNVAFPTLSPYTATFAGRKIASGKLSLELSYVVDDGELRGENDIRISNLKLGQRVDAPDALDLPLELAVALLTDSKGTISLDVPVRGSVGNPQFAVGALIRGAIGSAIRRVVTAPFRALGRSLGADGGRSVSGEVGFQYGSTELTPSGRESLDTLARAMLQRPRLGIAVAGPYDPVRDAHALRMQSVREALAERLGDGSALVANAGPIAFRDAEVQHALDDLLREREGHEARAADQSPAMYERIFERLVATQSLPHHALQTLAVRRAENIARHLESQGLAAQRIDTGRIVTVAAGTDRRVRASLTLAPNIGADETVPMAAAEKG